LLGAAGAVAAAALAIAAPAASASAADTNVCASIRAIVADDPEQALELIAQLRAPALAYVAAGVDVPQALADPDACEPVRLMALDALVTSSISPTPTWPEAFASGWQDFVDDRLAPLATMGLVFLAAVVGLGIGARFATLIPGIRSARATPAMSGTAGVLGGVGIVVGVACGLWAMSAFETRPDDGAIVVAWLIICLITALLGVVALAVGLATRLKLALDVRGADGKRDDWASARALGVLAELGGSPAKGLVPQGSDVDALASAIPKVGNTWWDAVVSVIRIVFLGTPWRIGVDTDATRVAVVSVRRNGRSIDVQRIVLDDDVAKERQPTELDAYIAAVVVTTLSRHHDGFEGLAGATQWRSVGMFALAGRLGDADYSARVLNAVRNDSGNHLARFAWGCAEYADEADQVPFVKWLRPELTAIAELPHGPAPLELEMRARRRLVGAQISLRADNRTAEASIDEMANNVIDLVTGLRKIPGPPTPLHEQLRLDASVFARIVQLFAESVDEEVVGLAKAVEGSLDWFTAAGTSMNPVVAYNIACHASLVGDLTTAADRLRVAVTYPALKVAARTDATLKRLRETTVFRKIVTETPRDDTWSLDPFTTLKPTLRECGVFRPDDLWRATGRYEIMQHLGLDRAVFARMVASSELVDRARVGARAVKVGGLEVELVAALMEEGISDRADVPAEWRTASTETPFTDAVRDINRRYGRSLQYTQARRWLDEVCA